MAVHLSDVRAALNRLDFPADKDAIIEYAEGVQADPEVVAVLRTLPVGEYQNVAEVLRSVDLPRGVRESERLKPLQARKRKNRVAEPFRDV
jgi:hypothetical protein